MRLNKKLLLILLLAAFLRFYKLGSNPPSLYWDEASLGFNAYSILKTLRDEHGEFLPLTRFIAFGDYKPVGYVYAAVPPIALFGLNEFAVRFPSALAGVLMVLVTYHLTLRFFSKRTALLSALILTISPWALHLSRGAFEANLAAFFNLAAIFFFLKGLRQARLLLLSSVFFALTLYTFNSNRLLTPILLFGLLIFYFKDLWKVKRWLLLSGLLGIFLISPLLPWLPTREARLRFDEVNIFSNLEVIETANRRIAVDGNTRLAKIIHHRYLGHFFNFLNGFLSFFEPRFLLLSGDVNPRLSSQAVGEIYPVELPFLLAGIYYLFRKRSRGRWFLCFWALGALVPPSTAREVPHALRSLSILPVPQIITAFGLINFFASLKIQKARLTLITVYGLLLTVYFLYYQYFYYFIYPELYSNQWQYGYKQLVQAVMEREENYQKILISDHVDRPYIYFLFYKRYPPQNYWQTGVKERDWYGFYWVKGFDKFEFGSVNPENYTEKEKILLAINPLVEIPNGFHKIKTINRLDGQAQFILIER